MALVEDGAGEAVESLDRQSAAGERVSLGEALLRAGLLTRDQLRSALRDRSVAAGRRERLGETVVRLGFATESEIARELAAQLRLEYVGPAELQPTEEALELISAGLAERHTIVPWHVEADGTLVVACADPTNFVAIEDARLASRVKRVRLAVATRAAVSSAIAQAYASDAQKAAGEVAEAMGERPMEESEAGLAPSDAPVIRLAEGIITQALDARASDIHVEPGLSHSVVRFRIDGVLKQSMTVPRSATGPLVSRLKLMSGMDIAERRRPQDGRARFHGGQGHQVDLRLSSLPSMHGEDIVVRLLRKGVEQLGMDEVGFSPEQLALARSVIERPQGLVLITGPTGSGKTSTLYALLAHLASETRKIITVEDPVEYELPGVNQTQVNERIGFTFARALRTVLRQDPDVVMVGEIRDPETAELAMQASLTGHLVLSTLHTNDAPSAIIRLRDLGIAPYLIASSLSLVLAQRLVRTVCGRCGRPSAPNAAHLEQVGMAPADEAEAADFRAGEGCEACSGTGYMSRKGLFEALKIDAAVRELVANQAAEGALRRAARAAGLRSLREDGIAKASLGITTLEEVLRVSPADDADDGACPMCARAIEPHFTVCPWCAAPLAARSCLSCQRELHPDWRACPSCAVPTGVGASADELDDFRVLGQRRG